MGKFHCYVSLPEGIHHDLSLPNLQLGPICFKLGWILFFDFACFPPPSSEVGDVWFKIDVRKTTCGDDGDGYMWQHLAASWHITPLLHKQTLHKVKEAAL